MLPKVATHILHQTSRAAAAVQNQTHTIRNVLQLQSSSGPSTSTTNLAPWNTPGSSSNWGSGGPGSGGAKYNAGSRFHSGYTGAGRTVTQANTITSHDGTFVQSDDNDEFTTVKRVSLHIPSRTRIRSRSLSISVQGHHEHGENLGVLATVQLHARSRHAFAKPASNDNSLVTDPVPVTAESRTVLVRRNSTSASLLPTSDTFDALPPPSPPLGRRNSTSAVSSASDGFDSLPSRSPSLSSVDNALPSTDPAAPQTTAPPKQTPERETSLEYRRLREARDSGDPFIAAEAVRRFRQTSASPSVAEFNMALEALHDTRRSGEPLNLILETYNDMLKHSLLPNLKTYFVLVLALTDRDHEIHKIVHTLQMRSKRRKLAGRIESVGHVTDGERVKQLRAENNFGSAMSLFEAIIAINGNNRLPPQIYAALLRSCSYHASVDSAIHVFAQLENRHDIKPTPLVYKYMISVYTNSGEIGGAKEIFEEFLRASKAGGIQWSVPKDPLMPKRAQLQVWNQMIEAYFRCGLPDQAIGLVDRMLSSTVGANYGPMDIPPPASSTFTAVLSGFCQSGDVSTALAWFDRLLQQNQTSRHPFEPSEKAMRPDVVGWMVILDALAMQGMVEELNRLFVVFARDAGKDGMEVRAVDRVMVFTANMNKLKTLDGEKAKETLDFLVNYVLDDSIHRAQMRTMIREICEQYVSRGMPEPAVELVQQFVASLLQSLHERETGRGVDAVSTTNTRQFIQTTVADFTGHLYEKMQGDIPFGIAMQMACIEDRVKVTPNRDWMPYFLHSYALAKQREQLPENLTPKDWELLLFSATDVELSREGESTLPTVHGYVFEGTVSLLQDIAARNVELEKMQPNLVRRTVKMILVRYGTEELRAIFERLGPSYAKVLENPGLMLDALGAAVVQAPPSPDDGSVYSSSQEFDQTQLRIDSYQTKFIDEVIGKHVHGATTVPQPLVAFQRFQEGVTRGKAPAPITIGRLIQSIGRLGELDKVGEAYTVAQTVLQSLELNKKWQSESWFMIEDSMIIALAHAGDVDSAHVHRARILEQGGAPTADAYGALILHVKDTTDDTSNAMALFQESQMQGVQPNQYLYNNIISKLAKARKADYALELFQQMKVNRIPPSSITYGAVIGACARVGDVHSAEMLFAEMVQARNFRPRVPPYNTMMQLYTTTKPNRERSLFFYGALRQAGVSPTAHTYKLLMDTYGILEPIDIDSMERVFQDLQNDRKVEIQGAHFASLINAYGCVQKDLDKAIAIFDSIPSHPRSLPPDAVVFEAMINVLVAHRRTELIPEYISRMSAAGVHMTAYIANFLIKGYAAIEDLERARDIFESLIDPPEGMAAPNNHISHEPGQSPAVNPMEPVYREPSTWEVMVRAELGSGNRDRAAALLERLQARKYPEAVYNRISGIMVDHSMVLQRSPNYFLH